MANITCQVIDPASRPVAGLRVILRTFTHRTESNENRFTACTSFDGRVNSWSFAEKHENYTLEQFFEKVVGNGESTWQISFGTGRFFGMENTYWPLIDINIHIKRNAHHHVSLVVGPDDYRSYLAVQPTLSRKMPAPECDKPEQEVKRYLVRSVEPLHSQVEGDMPGSLPIATDVVEGHDAKTNYAATNRLPSEAYVTTHTESTNAASREGPAEQDVSKVKECFVEHHQIDKAILVQAPEAKNQKVLKGRVGKTTELRRSSRQKSKDARLLTT
jgi:5-hydroxyisourate hydrolase